MGETRTKFQQFTTNGSWTAPAGVTSAQVIGVGGGGGGGSGGGGGNNSGSNTGGCGGGGGGGAPLGSFFVTVVPGTVYTITIGAAGTGGLSTTGLVAGNPGGDGGDTTFGALITFRGARGGAAGQPGTLSSLPTAARVNGGVPTRSVATETDGYHLTYPSLSPLPGQGGYSWTVISTGAWGSLGAQLQAGGSTDIALAGTGGGIVNNQTSGQGGGGGGASGWNGSTGGNGGAGSAGATAASAGTAGTLGGGGGGGGGVGQADTGTHGSGAGGNGGPGALMVIWQE